MDGFLLPHASHSHTQSPINASFACPYIKPTCVPTVLIALFSSAGTVSPRVMSPRVMSPRAAASPPRTGQRRTSPSPPQSPRVGPRGQKLVEYMRSASPSSEASRVATATATNSTQQHHQQPSTPIPTTASAFSPRVWSPARARSPPRASRTSPLKIPHLFYAAAGTGPSIGVQFSLTPVAIIQSTSSSPDARSSPGTSPPPTSRLKDSSAAAGASTVTSAALTSSNDSSDLTHKSLSEPTAAKRTPETPRAEVRKMF